MGMWIHYCRVTRFTRSTVLLLVSFLLAFKAAAAGMDGLYSLPLACAVLVVALPCEHLLGKLIIGWLPSSSTKKQREQTIEHEALDRPL